MKIKSVELETSHCIETENDEIFKRFCSGCWVKLYGESWEPLSYKDEEEVEKLFQEYIKNKQQKCRSEALQKMYENEEELGLDW